MARVDAYLNESGLEKNAYLLLQVHDELVYEIKKEKVKEIAQKIKAIMEGVLAPKDIQGVPLVVDVMEGNNWGEMS